MRVLQLIHDLGPGGAENVLVDLARVARGAGIELSVVSMMPLVGKVYPPILRDAGVDVYSLDLASRWDVSGVPRMIRLARRLQPAVLHTHLKHADILGAAASLATGIPMVSTLHLIENVDDPLGYLKRAAGAAARLRVARRTIAVSEAQRRWYLATFGSAEAATVVTVRNGVVAVAADAARRQALRAEFGVADDAVLCVMVGIMRPAKGHAELLDAIARLDPALPVHFVLAGDGELRDELVARAAGLAAAWRGRVVFAGFRDDVPELLDAADLVVHPTLADALPTALVHALAAGRCAVASDVGGVGEIVTPECGVLVPPGDCAALAAAISDLAVDPVRRAEMGRRAVARFDAEFDATVWASRLALLYAGVMRPAGGTRG